MAQEEEIIIIEDVDAIHDAHENGSQEHDTDDGSGKKKLIIFASLAVIIILAITLVILFSGSDDDNTAITNLPDTSQLDTQLVKHKEKPVEPSTLEKMIAKANYLYTHGNREKALDLYEQIANYSQAISMYNLGVAQLKDKQYKKALATFEKAINNDEKRCVSAINAAVCALHLHDKESFHYYIDLAYAYLPYEINSPLYSYYYTLIHYYDKDYLAALNALKNGKIDTYPVTQHNLKAKIDALYENDYDAIDALEQNYDEADDIALGLLYARVGDTALAVQHFNQAILKSNHEELAHTALALVYLKSGQIQNALKELNIATNKYPDTVYKPFPVKVVLKPSLFNPKKAQKSFRNFIVKDRNTIYQEIFYYSPYKMFNADQTISYIRKGNANTFIDNIQSAESYLTQGTAASNVNIGMTLAIKKALNLHLREANQKFQQLVKIQPKHSILQYNLALTYAQLGNLNKAHEHFLRSYYLDSKNYLAGIYAVYTAQLTNKKYTKLKSVIKDSLHQEDDSEEKEFYKTLLAIAENNYISAADWLDTSDKKRPLYLVINTIIAQHIGNKDTANESTSQLVALLPNDLLPHMMYMQTHFQDLNDVEYPQAILKYMKDKTFTYDDLYYGAYITRYLYTQINLITGKLYFLRQQLKDKLATTSKETQEITAALALASLYDRAFEESYTLYNTLVDELKIRDPYTLYLAAVASTAAEHHANAIALLELSKRKNRTFYESRYALGLLYMEVQNNEGAAIEFSKIASNNFRSRFFDFQIDTQKLLFEKQHQEK